MDEAEDYLEINKVRIAKPLVEKPISGEDHNIYIYYPRSHGGGSKRLFRKRADRSSQYYPDVHHTRVRITRTRHQPPLSALQCATLSDTAAAAAVLCPVCCCVQVHDGQSYIYEELLQTEGTDVKVYAVGVEYAHAEARKSPVVDGKVMRNARGREVRYPVILTASEKEMARKVVLAFGQTLCGFDILRSNGKSYVCDVNGWSSVKDSHKFWDDSANLLRQYCLEQLAPTHLATHPQPGSSQFQSLVRSPIQTAVHGADHVTFGVPPMVNLGGGAPTATAINPRSEIFGSTENLPCSVANGNDIVDDADGELLCVVAFTRHADRTPKQKLKFTTSEPTLLSLITEHGKGGPREELKIKNIRLMEELTQRVEAIVDRMRAIAQVGSDEDHNSDTLEKFVAVKQVLKSHPFSGINRKVQLKPTAWATRSSGASATASGSPSRNGSSESVPTLDVSDPSAGSSEVVEAPTEATFILKWGGELTALGEAQAGILGTRFRQTLYPGEMSGVLRLHSTYRHDLKIYSSDEGRVQMTAAAFAKGFLDLEGRLTPILASLVSKHHYITKMLDETPDAGRAEMEASKAIIHQVLTSEVPLSSDDDLASAIEELMHTTQPVKAPAAARSSSAPPQSNLPPPYIEPPPAEAPACANAPSAAKRSVSSRASPRDRTDLATPPPHSTAGGTAMHSRRIV